MFKRTPMYISGMRSILRRSTNKKRCIVACNLLTRSDFEGQDRQAFQASDRTDVFLTRHCFAILFLAWDNTILWNSNSKSGGALFEARGGGSPLRSAQCEAVVGLWCAALVGQRCRGCHPSNDAEQPNAIRLIFCARFWSECSHTHVMIAWENFRVNHKN